MPVGKKSGYKAINGGGVPGKSKKTAVKKVAGKKAATKIGTVKGKASPIKKTAGKRLPKMS